MGRSYYYFGASLPMLEWKGKLPLTVNDFLEDCHRLMIKEDYDIVAQLVMCTSLEFTGNQLADEWICFDRSFRNEMALVRAQRFNKDPFQYYRGFKESEPQWRDVIQQALKIHNLLEAELILDRARWQFLDQLVSGHYYDLEYVIVYGLKLAILERQDAYHSPKGREVFDELRMTEIPADCIVESNTNL